FSVYKFIPIATAITQKIPVHRSVITILYASQMAVPLSRNGVEAQPAMDTTRRCGLQIPFTGVVTFKRLVGKNAGRAYLDKIAAEFVLQDAFLMPPEINMMMRRKSAEVATSCVVPVKPDAAVALDAAVHFVINERPHMLIPMGPLFETETAVAVPCHYRHVLQMAFASFVADRTVMRMIGH